MTLSGIEPATYQLQRSAPTNCANAYSITNRKFYYLPDKRRTETKRHYIIITFHLEHSYERISPTCNRESCSEKATHSEADEGNKHTQKSSGKKPINCTPQRSHYFAINLLKPGLVAQWV
jgi:hypothetical protein